MKSFLACFMIVFAIGFLSCEDKSISPITNDNLNAPVTTNVTNSFSYSVNANQYSSDGQNTLSFLSDSLIVTLSSSEYQSGQVVVSVRDTLNAVIFADTVRSNKTIAIVGLKATKPKYCGVVLANLTGKLVFVLVGQ